MKSTAKTKNLRDKKRNKKDKPNYTECSSHSSISGKYFFFALHSSSLKILLKISTHLMHPAGMFLKIKSFLTVQMLQHIIMIISIKNLTFS